MRITLFLLSIFLSGSSFAQSITTDASSSLLETFNAKSRLNAEVQHVRFTENKGQIHDQHDQPRPDVLFGGTAGDLAFHLKTYGVSYQLTRVDTYKEVEDPKTNDLRQEVDQQTVYRVDLRWLNANTHLVTSTDQALEGYNNYYLESCPDGALQVKSYTGVTLHNLYDGIDLHYYDKEGELKHDYMVAPGANYHQIQLKVDGATVRINADGSLTLDTPLGEIQEGAPVVFQNGKQLKAKWKVANNTLRFEIENYNPSQALIIDPVTRTWGTYYGGSGIDRGYSCTTDATGHVYLAGSTTTSTASIIATAGAHQTVFVGGVNDDAFLVKFNADGVRQWGTYYGGAADDSGYSCAVDAAGNVCLTGITESDSGTAIATANSHQPALNDNQDAFLVKFNSSGVRQWGTYYGGTSNEFGWSCSFDASGNVYMAGATASGIGTSIATAGSHQPTNGGGSRDAFLVKFNSNGVRQWGTYYGGSGVERGRSCFIDLAGNVYLAGSTSSDAGTVIATAGSHQSTIGGSDDAFLVKFNSNGVRQWGTYYGGTESDLLWGASPDSFGNIFITGYASSATANAIATEGAHQATYGGGFDAFLAKFDSNGVRQWGTYYGGALGNDIGFSCATDASGNVYLAGETSSPTGLEIASSDGYQTEFGGDFNAADAFLAKFDSNGIRQWGTYYGGSLADAAQSCVPDASGIVYMAGTTRSNVGTVIASTGAHQSIAGASEDAFLVKFFECNGPSTATVNQTTCASFTWALTGTTYTTSGTYSYTDATNEGCELTTVLNLTINNATTETFSEAACESYTWGLNGSTYTSSGTYTHLGTNANGCVLTSTLELTINNATTETVFDTGCDAYTWALNGTTYTNSGSYTHIGTNAQGCQLTTTLELTIDPTTTAVTETACDSYNWALDGNTYSTPGTYTYEGINASGCPLTATLNLAINSTTTGIDTQSSCETFTWIDGNTYTESNNSATYALTNAAGCDSIVTLNLSILQATSGIDTQSSCDPFTWINGTTYTASNNTATFALNNAAGCDSIVTLNFTLNAADVSTTVAGSTITANASGADYQWINCANGNSPIEGQTGQSFTATSSGNYAVIVTQNGCEDTSDCVDVTIVSVDEITADDIVIYPNPSRDAITITSSSNMHKIALINAIGQEVAVYESLSVKKYALVLPNAIGTYLVKIYTDERMVNKLVVKQ